MPILFTYHALNFMEYLGVPVYVFPSFFVPLSAIMSLCLSRIVCEMGKAEKSQYTGNVQVCVGVGECRPEFMAKSSKYYYFVVSVYLY